MTLGHLAKPNFRNGADQPTAAGNRIGRVADEVVVALLAPQQPRALATAVAVARAIARQDRQNGARESRGVVLLVADQRERKIDGLDLAANDAMADDALTRVLQRAVQHVTVAPTPSTPSFRPYPKAQGRSSGCVKRNSVMVFKLSSVLFVKLRIIRWIRPHQQN